MARKASIRPSKLPPPPSRKDRLAKAKAVRILRAERQTRPVPDVDPIEYARAFALFAPDMELLSVEEQERFQATLRGYLAGVIEHEEWRHVVGALSALRRAATPPEPRGYWGRRYRSYSMYSEGW
ncbi:hypothetical protein KIH24_05660 [Rhizobiales bacterium TNE-4]|nr:hypothetical protein [Rhizobiales bacterium TNE-4]MBV1827109.1 hypothetical protein [Rhizobiales bacterium TNE-4]